MATGSKGGLYQNAQSASYLPLTLAKCQNSNILVYGQPHEEFHSLYNWQHLMMKLPKKAHF